jgi:hypothetical protein
MRRPGVIYNSGFIAIVLLFSTIHYSCSYKQSPAINNYPERYTLDIPNSWAKKTKTIKAITDIVPATAEELKDKQFCMNCTAGYTVKLIIENPIVETYSSENRGSVKNLATSQQVTGFRFKSYFAVYNKKNEGVVKIIITDPERDLFLWRSNSSGGGAYGDASTGSGILRSYGKMLGKYDTYDIDPRDYSQQYSYSSNTGSAKDRLDKTVLLNYAEQKLYSMRDLIRNWEDDK